MLTPARLREYTGPSGALDLLRDLGYPIAPVDVDPAEWRRGGVTIPWNGEAQLQLAARLSRFDLFLLTGNVPEEAVAEFMRSYGAYNIKTKSVIAYVRENAISIFDLSANRTLRRLDVDLQHPTPHAIDRLNLLACSGTSGDESALSRIYDRALDRESVTREFFLRFRAAVGDVAAALRESFPDEEREAVDAEALLILSRLLFLSFVQEKGWLNGERRFLVDRLHEQIRRRGEFFAGVLLPLFFGCLNTPLRERSAAARKLGRIPYLNGGLFEPSSFEQRHVEMYLPNELMRRVLEDVFEKFDFRLDEGDGAGTHVDPEMLGKVFESLMAADERAASGSFYTPKEIVDVLVERAIAEWLGDAPVEVQLAKLERITILDPACGSGAFLLSALGAIERLWRARTSDVPRDLRRRIVAHSLYGVDLNPRAVRLCELRLWLAIVSGSAADADADHVEPLPNLDRNILQGNALLSPTDFLGDGRLSIYADWLHALRAQRDLLDRYRTAPHAQRPALYRLIRGNDQRLASELLARSIDESESELQLACAPQRDLFGRSIQVDPERCRELHQRIAEQKKMLDAAEEGTLDFFSFDVHFAHVMAGDQSAVGSRQSAVDTTWSGGGSTADRRLPTADSSGAGGFDVVAGNPPWVRNSRIDARTKRMLADRYALFRGQRDGTAFHQPDLSVAFFERALSLAAPDGVVALLMPAKIVNAGYAGPLRRAARERVIAIDDWSDSPRRRSLFEADTFPLGITCRGDESAVGGRRSAAEKTLSGGGSTADRRLPTADCVRITAGDESFDLPRAALSVDGASSEWALVPPAVASIAQRLRGSHRSLAEGLGRKPFMGVKTGDNRSFFLEAKSIRGDRLITTDGVRIPLSAVCRCVRGRDLQRWTTTGSQWMLWPPRGGWRKPPAWLVTLAEKRGLDPSDFRLSFVRAEHVGIKVAWKDLSRGVAAAVLPDVVHVNEMPFPLVPNQTLYAIDAVSLDEAYMIAAVLNSTIAGALLVGVAERAKDSHYRYFGRTMAALPWPDLRAEWDRLVRLSRRAHRPDAQREPIECEVNEIVARLYGVSAVELASLQTFLERRIGAR
ncbi:MAG: N-6 DNA methylase [Acidobacteriota bacterium]|nr:N-6 DNA methylase [Acidobacteriota bacterium]